MPNMVIALRIALFTLVCTFWVPADETVPGTENDRTGYDEPKTIKELVDGLNQANMQEAFQLLRNEYIKKQDLDDLNLNRSAFQGLVERLGFGASLFTETSLAAQNSPYDFYTNQITGKLAYIRFGKFTASELTDFDKAIKKYNSDNTVKTIILDLRSPQAQADFTIAASILSRFRPPNEMLFKIRRPDTERPILFQTKTNEISWSNEVVVLVDTETGNVGEIIAKLLQSKSNSLVIGEQTPGLTVEYREATIGEDRILRYAVAEVTLDDESSIFKIGVTPDLLTKSNLKSKQQLFSETNKGIPLNPYLFKVERPRLNERALVERTDPELEYRLALMNGEKTEWNTEYPEDKILQKAVDILRTRDFLKSGKRKRKLR